MMAIVVLCQWHQIGRGWGWYDTLSFFPTSNFKHSRLDIIYGGSSGYGRISHDLPRTRELSTFKIVSPPLKYLVSWLTIISLTTIDLSFVLDQLGGLLLSLLYYFFAEATLPYGLSELRKSYESTQI